MNKVIKILDRITDFVGYIATTALLLMLVNVFYDVIMRYFFHNSSVGMQELEWHLFSIVFLFGIAYSLKENAHVRVDMFYENMSPTKQAIINILGSIIFIIPFSLLIISSGSSFAYEAYSLNEMSGDPGGLPFRWVIKSAIALSFLFLIIATISFILHNIQTILTSKKDIKEHSHSEEVL